MFTLAFNAKLTRANNKRHPKRSVLVFLQRCGYLTASVMTKNTTASTLQVLNFYIMSQSLGNTKPTGGHCNTNQCPEQRLRYRTGHPAQVPGLARRTFGCIYCRITRRFSYLCAPTEPLTGDFTGRERRDDIAVAVPSFSSCTRVGTQKHRHYFFFLD